MRGQVKSKPIAESLWSLTVASLAKTESRFFRDSNFHHVHRTHVTSFDSLSKAHNMCVPVITFVSLCPKRTKEVVFGRRFAYFFVCHNRSAVHPDAAIIIRSLQMTGSRSRTIIGHKT